MDLAIARNRNTLRRRVIGLVGVGPPRVASRAAWCSQCSAADGGPFRAASFLRHSYMNGKIAPHELIGFGGCRPAVASRRARARSLLGRCNRVDLARHQSLVRQAPPMRHLFIITATMAILASGVNGALPRPHARREREELNLSLLFLGRRAESTDYSCLTHRPRAAAAAGCRSRRRCRRHGPVCEYC